ncbi:MAG: FxsA family protein [Planctomycetes bacterium]|nr:FxsA family protein [Planctomycetota bacterium]
MFSRLFLLFVIVPVADLALLLFLGARMGLVPTLVVVVATAAIGAYLVRTQGARVARALLDNLFKGKVLPEQLADAALVLVGGAFLLTPGFVTDVAGLLMILPWTRPLARKVLFWILPFRFSVSSLMPWSAQARPRTWGAEAIRDVEAKVRDAAQKSGEPGPSK